MIGRSHSTFGRWASVFGIALAIAVIGCGGSSDLSSTLTSTTTTGSTNTTGTNTTTSSTTGTAGAVPNNAFLWGIDAGASSGSTYGINAYSPSSGTLAVAGSATGYFTLVAPTPAQMGQFVGYNSTQVTLSGVTYSPGFYLLKSVTSSTGWQLAGATLIGTAPTAAPYVNSLAVTSDAQDVLFTSSPDGGIGDSTLYMLPLSGAAAATALDSGFNDAEVVTAAASSKIAFIRYGANSSTEVYAGAVASGQVTAAFAAVTSDTQVHRYPALSADGSTLAFEEGDAVNIRTGSAWATSTVLPTIVDSSGGAFVEGGIALDSSGATVACFGEEYNYPDQVYLYTGQVSSLTTSTSWTPVGPALGTSTSGLVGPYWSGSVSASLRRRSVH